MYYLHAPEGEVAVAERGADDFYACLVGFRWSHLHLLDLERFAGSSAHRRCWFKHKKERIRYQKEEI